MSLPIVVLQTEEKWDCHQCGHCCRGSLIPLSNSDLARIQSQNWSSKSDFAKIKFLTRDASAESGFRLGHHRDGTCVFLTEHGLCRIHSEYGHDEKPTACQVFPLQLVPHERRSILTLRRACPSAAADLGTATDQHLPRIREMVSSGQLKSEPRSSPALKPGEQRNWKTTERVFDSIAGVLQDVRFPPVRRLVHALQFASLLERAKTKELSDAKVHELSKALAELVVEESRPFFEDRQPPKAYTKIVFRFMAVDCARLHPNSRQKPVWSSRLQLARTAWQVVVGGGKSPYLNSSFPRVDLESLEQPTGPLPPEVYLPLSRLIETSSESCLYALADRHNWSVVESLRGLALLFPVGLWLLRWISYGRTPEPEDMQNLVVALDRSQGYAPLTGALHRRRIALLAANSELERLVVWYAR